MTPIPPVRIWCVSYKTNLGGINTPALVTAAANLGPAATFMPVQNRLIVVLQIRATEKF